MKKELSIREHQDIMLNLMVAFDRFCEEKHLRYHLAYGTLLGAVRHHGFIPWDDDVDIVMPRPDYEQMISYIYIYIYEQCGSVSNCICKISA